MDGDTYEQWVEGQNISTGEPKGRLRKDATGLRFVRRGIRLLREVLGRPLSHGPTDVSDAEAARSTETYRIFLDMIGDGVALTAAGYLPPVVVERVAELSGVTG